MIDTSKKPEYVVIVIGKKGSGKSTILNNLIQTKIFLDEKEENSIGIISHFFQRKKKEPLYSLYELQSEIYEINHNDSLSFSKIWFLKTLFDLAYPPHLPTNL